MVTLDYGWGNRLGNTMLMYAAAYIFAQKHNLFFNVPSSMPHFPLSPEKPNLTTTGFNEAGFPLHTKPLLTTRKFETPCYPVHDLNFIELLNSTYIPDAHWHFQHYFQLKDFVLPYKQQIREIFNLEFTTRPANEIFVIFRLGDVSKRRQRLPVQYYIDAIEKLYQQGCYGGYITSDSPEHAEVKYLAEKYNLKLYTSNVPIETINFGKDFNNLVLSEGTYCWWVGVLSNATYVYFNDRKASFTWHGDIFVYPEWKSLCYDNPELPIDPA